MALLVMWTLYRVVSQHSDQPALVRPAGTLAALLFVQLLLGVASYIVREWTRDAPQPLPFVVWTTVAHVAAGALTLAASVWLTLSAAYALPVARRRESPVAIPA